MLGLEIAERRPAARTPVDEIAIAIDEALLVEGDEHFAHRARQPFVHGEALALPVAGNAEAGELAGDRRTGLALPRPDALDELLAAERSTVAPGVGELALDDVLRGDARMVRAGDPGGHLAAHAVVATEDVLDRVVERMAHVQRSGDVGRRDDHREGLPGALLVTVEIAALPPHAVPALLDGRWLVGLGQLH